MAAVPECAIFKMMEQQLNGWLSQCRETARSRQQSARESRERVTRHTGLKQAAVREKKIY